MPEPRSRPLDPELLFRALARHGVRFVLVGAMGARLYGFPRMTADADIVPARDAENLERLADALHDLNARVYTESVPEGLPFDVSAKALDRANLWNLVTDGGRLDIIFTPAGTRGFDDLAPRAERFEVYGDTLLVARLEDILRSKVAADRLQDRQDAIVIRAMLQRRLQRRAPS